jgi:hypothetical protein
VRRALAVVGFVAFACGTGKPAGGADAGAGMDVALALDVSSDDASLDAAGLEVDAADAATREDAAPADAGVDCEVFGAPGECVPMAACAALGDHTAYAGHCPGPADIQCCIKTPSTADNPPVPAGWKLMAQADVTAEMTAWAVSILNDPITYPMFSTTIRTFGTLMVMARVEWHPPDFNNGAVHRGVTLYQPQ